MSDSGADVKLYSAWYCPFAQRTWVSLLLKGVQFEYVEVDPFAKPPELLAVNPYGQVPALTFKDQNIYESLVTMEFLEDAYPDSGRRLLPVDPVKRAHVRIWADYCSKKIVPLFYRLLKTRDTAKQEVARHDLLEHIRVIIKAMNSLSEDGPFFAGDELGFADLSVAPWVERFYILKHHRGFEVPGSVNDKDGEYYRFHKWWEAVREVPDYKATCGERERLLQFYIEYANKNATD
ncbi:uncharacterized protein LOC135815310 [Sycon ciliatum]|uniref:uncharacterized protein LOC135815310 n=1 Tax=Sycon ciliatum TaxID=27933 RepID=UPI0031F6646D